MIDRRRLLAVFAISLTIGCGSGSVTPGVVTPVVVLGYSVLVRTPPPAFASPGSHLPVVFSVTENASDGTTRPAAGKSLSVVVMAGGGVINGTASTALITDADGSVSAIWALGSAIGTQSVRGSLTSTDYADFSVASSALPTLLVTNGSCAAGACRTLEIRAFVSKFNVPGQLPTGMGFIGYAPPGQSCLPFPPSWTLTVTGPNNQTIITWTPVDSTSIYLVAVDSAIYRGGLKTPAQADSINHAIFPFDGLFGEATMGETPQLVVRDAPGWTVTFPAAPAFGARLAQAAACNH